MKPRHHIYLDTALTTELDTLAKKPGTSKSAIVTAALKAYLSRRAAQEIDDRFKVRLDRLTTQLNRMERDQQILLESLALFIRYQFTVTPQLSDADQAAARAVANDRYQAFIGQIGRRIAGGRTLSRELTGGDPPAGRDESPRNEGSPS
ncbi:MAG: CopG family transcriptional regulator [Caulobacteraceae bacterium]